MRKFDYRDWGGVGVIWLKIGGFASIILGTLGAMAVFVAGIVLKATLISNLWISGWILVIGWMVGGMLVNLYPTVWLDEKGLKISFFHFWRKNVSWTKITDLRELRLVRSRVIAVQSTKITIWHRLIGWSYSRRFSPQFLISSDIENFEELIAELESRLQETNRL